MKHDETWFPTKYWTLTIQFDVNLLAKTAETSNLACKLRWSPQDSWYPLVMLAGETVALSNAPIFFGWSIWWTYPQWTTFPNCWPRELLRQSPPKAKFFKLPLQEKLGYRSIHTYIRYVILRIHVYAYICIALYCICANPALFLPILRSVMLVGSNLYNSTNEDSKTTVGMMDIWYLFSIELGDESPKQPVTRQVSLMV